MSDRQTDKPLSGNRTIGKVSISRSLQPKEKERLTAVQTHGSPMGFEGRQVQCQVPKSLRLYHKKKDERERRLMDRLVKDRRSLARNHPKKTDNPLAAMERRYANTTVRQEGHNHRFILGM